MTRHETLPGAPTDHTGCTPANALSAPEIEATILAGGTDILGEVKEGTASPAAFVDITGLEGLSEIQMTEEDGASIGSLVTLARDRKESWHRERLHGPCAVCRVGRHAADQERRHNGRQSVSASALLVLPQSAVQLPEEGRGYLLRGPRD